MRAGEFLTEVAKVRLSTNPKDFGAYVTDKGTPEKTVMLPVSKISIFEPDDKFDDQKHTKNLDNIIKTIKLGKELPPILVRRQKLGYQVLDGHHRFKAYKMLGKKEIPARIVSNYNVKDIKEANYPSDKIGKIKTIKATELKDTYSDEQMLAMGFKKESNSTWTIPMLKWQKLRYKNKFNITEGEVIPFKRPIVKKEPINVLSTIKHLCSGYVSLFWTKTDRLPKAKKEEVHKTMELAERALKDIGYELVVSHRTKDIVFLHSIEKEFYIDSGNPIQEYKGKPDLMFNGKTNMVKAVDLSGNDITNLDEDVHGVAKKHKVFINLNKRSGGNHWSLDGIDRGEKSENTPAKKGSGEKVMKELISDADKAGKHILLHPTNKKLNNYYKKFGFKDATKKDIENFSGRLFGGGMVRYHK